jgi:hypothetical protein
MVEDIGRVKFVWQEYQAAVLRQGVPLDGTGLRALDAALRHRRRAEITLRTGT